VASKKSDAGRERSAIIGALNLLSAQSDDTILAHLPAGAGEHVERMCERLRDHLRKAIGMKPDGNTSSSAYGDACADKWLAVTEEVADTDAKVAKWSKAPVEKRRRNLADTLH